MEDTNTDRLTKIKTQIEYYLSDKNMEHDKFFNEKIREDLNGYVDISYILNCNKIKTLLTNEEEIVRSLKDSDNVELDSSEKRVRRKDNKPLPTLKLLKQKRKSEENETEGGEHLENADLALDPFILEISADKEIEFKWKNIQDEFKKLNSNLNVVYLRFKDCNGHIGLYKKSNQEITFTPELEIEGVKFTIKKCEGDNLINFWKEHGSHFDFCVGKSKSVGDNRKNKFDKNRLRNPVTLGDESFSEISKIRTRARTILVGTKDNEPVAPSDQQFLVDLLKHHYNSEEKLKNLDHITAGSPSAHTYSRCFFLVKNDENKTRCDFSVYKCIERLQNMNDKKKK